METKEITRYPVHIVGAGPGDPDLLTVKAQRLLEEADVLFYDCLPAEHVLKSAHSAEVLYINKHPEAGEKKEDILEYVKQYYLEGKKVVRLKAGDALMFNGGDVEARILKEWGIPFELVPGLTAAAAASNIFAIPTTEIHKSNAIVNVIAYEINDDYAHIRDIAKLFKHGTTIALYMAFDNLKRIFEVFKEEGVREDIPVVIAAMVSLQNQDAAKATMDTVFEVINQREMLLPFVFFIGEHIDIYK
ncbi:uroporphyrin-III C-methyltransferase [Bacteroidia bacterium]|nr:uroporphyrin-III C-methyltransferase [Bacteroidia bacterium]